MWPSEDEAIRNISLEVFPVLSGHLRLRSNFHRPLHRPVCLPSTVSHYTIGRLIKWGSTRSRASALESFGSSVTHPPAACRAASSSVPERRKHTDTANTAHFTQPRPYWNVSYGWNRAAASLNDLSPTRKSHCSVLPSGEPLTHCWRLSPAHSRRSASTSDTSAPTGSQETQGAQGAKAEHLLLTTQEPRCRSTPERRSSRPPASGMAALSAALPTTFASVAAARMRGEGLGAAPLGLCWGWRTAAQGERRPATGQAGSGARCQTG